MLKTTINFKVGDKVYVLPEKPTFPFKNCIRATVTEVRDDGFGYSLRAFKKDLPGIYMFNIFGELPTTLKGRGFLLHS